MAHREVLIWPDPRLTRVSEPIEKIDDEVRALVQDLLDTMRYEGDAAGLAAPQIGVNKRVFIADIPPEYNNGQGTKGPEAFINLEFIEMSGKRDEIEGCLSIPGESGKVTRAKHVVVKYLDINGVEHTREADDYLAQCLQHENDHLDGVLWVDYQSRLKKDMIKKKMVKLIKMRLDHAQQCKNPDHHHQQIGP